MAKFHLSNRAVQDLSEIWEYTYDNWSEKIANNYYKSLLQACREASENPKFGKLYGEIQKDLLGFKSNRHIIFFKIISPKVIEIARILHERMDIKSKF